LIIGIGLLGCSKREGNTTSQTDSSDSKSVYSALTLDEYKEFYNSDSTFINVGALADLTIDFDCAVLIYPTEEEIDKMKKAYGEDDFYVIADDNNWY
jgi:hypothetical protein